MSITKESKQNIFEKFSRKKDDTGSPEVQIAVLSERIKSLTEHFKKHKFDRHSRRGLIAMVTRRKKLLQYLFKKDEKKYKDLIKELNIRG